VVVDPDLQGGPGASGAQQQQQQVCWVGLVAGACDSASNTAGVCMSAGADAAVVMDLDLQGPGTVDSSSSR
jgi:hypothetical protein